MYKKSIEEVLESLETGLNGIKSENLEKLVKKYGYNELQEKGKVTVWELFVESFKDPLVIILLIAASVQILTGHLVDSLIILIVLTLNSVIGVVQAKKAEGSLEKLKQLSQPNIKVLRDGEKKVISMKEIFPGDIVILDAGDYIPADGRLVEANTLKIMEGILTGESEPVLKHCDLIDKDLPLGDRKNMVYSGTMVVYGRGAFVVTETGMQTEIGKIATLLDSVETGLTPLQKNLEKFTKKLGIGILGMSVLIFAVIVTKGILAGNTELFPLLLDAFMFSVAVAVAAIPEALSSIVTIVLSFGTGIMATKHAIIRKLSAVETLGSTSIICTDKTGTLTQNKMTVVSTFLKGIEVTDFEKTIETLNQESLYILGLILANDSQISVDGKEIGDPTEVALIHFAAKHGIDVSQLRESYKRISELPFDSDRKLMSTLNQFGDKKVIFCKGAPDVIFSRSTRIVVNNEVVPATVSRMDVFREKNEEFSKEALRVLGITFKIVNSEKVDLTLDDEQDMTLLGLVAMIDPPREEVYEAIKEAKAAGIRSIMITGDHKTTAAAIARDIGLMSSGEKALTGQELDELTEEELDNELENITVYARVSPENKIRIVKAWQKKGKITAMTGDGVNDAPALKQADIGIAMGTGTDVAKDSAAMILTDDNFVSIVSAIEIGRTVYSNIKKSITYLFVGNLGAILSILYALFAGWNSPFTALQLLFINLVNDSLPAISLGLEPSEDNIMSKKPREANKPLFNKQNYITIFFRGVLIAMVTILAQYIGGAESLMGMSMAFTTLIFARTLQTLPGRSEEKTAASLGFLKNKYTLIAIVVCFIMYSMVLYPSVRPYFNIDPDFGLFQLKICLLLAVISTALMELEKVLKFKK
ncbi:MAG: cation-translocating P-type ATPase [Fusobacteriaceae bacterium]